MNVLRTTGDDDVTAGGRIVEVQVVGALRFSKNDFLHWLRR